MALSNELITKIINHEILISEISNRDLGDFCEYANSKYRVGSPIISDQDYDFIFLKELKLRNPNHKIFQNIENEGEGFSEEKNSYSRSNAIN